MTEREINKERKRGRELKTNLSQLTRLMLVSVVINKFFVNLTFSNKLSGNCF